MATSEQIIGLVRAIAGNDAGMGRRIAQQIALDAKTSGQTKVAEAIQKHLGSSAQATKLQESVSDLIWWETPNRSLKSVELTPENRKAVTSMLRDNRNAMRLDEFGLKPRQKLLLSGPSGTGKTTLARAIAYELNRPFGMIRLGGLIDSYVGGTGRSLTKIWDCITRPCVVLFDEWDAIAGVRGGRSDSADKEANRVVCTLLTLMERTPLEAIVIAATNVPERCDSALERRFDVRLTLDLPSEEHIVRFANDCALKWPDLVLPAFKHNLGHSFATAEQAVVDAAREAILAKCGD